MIDFEDVLLGFPMQDIAICLYYLRNYENYPELAAAFQSGYATERDWPSFSQSDLHTLWMGRMANFANYAAQVDEPRAPASLSRRAVRSWEGICKTIIAKQYLNVTRSRW